MDDLLESIKEKYLDDITSRHPLFRIFSLVIFSIAAHTYTQPNSSGRFLQECSALKIKFIVNFEDGLFSELTLAQLFAAILATSVVAICYTKFKYFAFNVLSKAADFEGYTSKITQKLTSQKSTDASINYFVSKDISIELKSHRDKIKSQHAIGECTLAAIACVGYGLSSLVWVDYFLIAAGLSGIFYIQYHSFRYYVSKFIPYYVAERALLGAAIKFGSE